MTHPLVRELASALGGDRGDGNDDDGRRVLLLGIGSGRHIQPLLEAGFRIDVVEDDPERALAAMRRFSNLPRVRIARARYTGPYPFSGGFAGALSTHALLHGSSASVAATVAAVRARLDPGAPFFATLGSTRDPRFGAGRKLDVRTFAPTEGSEAGVPHVYFDEPAVRTLFGDFTLDALEETSAAQRAGSWAHTPEEAASLFHWFVHARR